MLIKILILVGVHFALSQSDGAKTALTRQCRPYHQYDTILGKCVAVTCDAKDACPKYEVCTPEKRECVRAPCPQFSCSGVCPSCAAVSCMAGSDCICGKCKPACSTCDTVRCMAGYHCKCGKCLPVEPTCGTCTTVKCSAGYQCKCGKCVPVEPTCSTCDTVRCMAGYQCKCGKCVPVAKGKGKGKGCDVCTLLCSPGTHCVCGKCVPLGGCDTCATILCSPATRCVCGKCVPFDVAGTPPAPQPGTSGCDTCATILCSPATRCVCGNCVPFDITGSPRPALSAPQPDTSGTPRPAKGKNGSGRALAATDRPVCPSCAAVLCLAETECICGRCTPVCRTCDTVKCSAGYTCKCGACHLDGQGKGKGHQGNCGAGQEWDYLLHKCVTVSCADPHACKRSEQCVPTSIMCIRAPCPQFACEPK